MHNRPKNTVLKLLKNMQSAEFSVSLDVNMISENTFEV